MILADESTTKFDMTREAKYGWAVLDLDQEPKDYESLYTIRNLIF